MDAMESPRSPKRRRILASMNTAFAADQDTDMGRKIHQTPASASAIFPPQSGPSRTPDPECPRGNIAAEPSGATDQDPRIRQTSEPRASKVRFKSPSRRGHRSRREDDDDRRRRRRDHDRDRDRDRHRDRDQDQDGEGSREKDGDRSSRHKHRRHRSQSRSRSPISSSHRHRSHRHHHRRKRRHHSPKTKEAAETEPEPQDPFTEEPLDPEEAFRQSLFDAMADDEGAAYWEGVYGQPIHIYSSDRVNPQGELERMTDEEYAAYVRQKMWEKTHAGLVEERKKREKRKKMEAEQAEERKRKEEEDMRIQIELERSLRRGEKRKAKKVWREKWDGYVDAWSRWDGKSVDGIPWPVERSAGEGDGKEEQVDPAAVRAFFVNGLNLEDVGEKEFAAKLKDERVRWHPDKFQQKLGGTVEGGVMRDVTAIFQAIDALWNDTRKNT